MTEEQYNKYDALATQRDALRLIVEKWVEEQDDNLIASPLYRILPPKIARRLMRTMVMECKKILDETEKQIEEL